MKKILLNKNLSLPLTSGVEIFLGCTISEFGFLCLQELPQIWYKKQKMPQKCIFVIHHGLSFVAVFTYVFFLVFVDFTFIRTNLVLGLFVYLGGRILGHSILRKGPLQIQTVQLFRFFFKNLNHYRYKKKGVISFVCLKKSYNFSKLLGDSSTIGFAMHIGPFEGFWWRNPFLGAPRALIFAQSRFPLKIWFLYLKPLLRNSKFSSISFFYPPCCSI